MKIRAVGAELFHVGARADRQAYVTKLIATFRNSEKVPKNNCNYMQYCDILIPHANA